MTHIKAPSLLIVTVLFSWISAVGHTDDNGFRSIRELKAAEPGLMSHIDQDNLDEIFDTQNAVQALDSAKRVRLFRQEKKLEELEKWEEPVNLEDTFSGYSRFERKARLKDALGKRIPTVEIPESAFRPVLKLISDSENYGDISACMFESGLALIIGDDEPEFALVCCFKCHDVRVVRRPTAKHPMPQVAKVGMSPELEQAIFQLARSAYPKDKSLQTFKLDSRRRAATPLKESTLYQRRSGTSSEKP